MNIIQELPTNKPNFFFKGTQDFNQTTHVWPQEPIVFIDNINLHLNCLGSVKDVFKWSHHGHIKTTLIFLSRKHTISRINWLDLLSTLACFTTLKPFYVKNNWVLFLSFILFKGFAFAVECTMKNFITHFLEDAFVCT